MKLALITDIHEQVHSLERALAVAGSMGCDEVACLGDITGYDPLFFAGEPGRSASECIRLIRENCRWVVAGNHDRQAADENPELGAEDIAWLDALPDHAITESGGRRVLLSHYVYPDFTGSTMVFLRRQSQLAAVHDFFTRENISIGFTGHDHPAGAGFCYPAPLKWSSRLSRAVQYMPFNRYHLDGERMICLLPALATLNSRPGITVWDSATGVLDVIQLKHN